MDKCKRRVEVEAMGLCVLERGKQAWHRLVLVEFSEIEKKYLKIMDCKNSNIKDY